MNLYKIEASGWETFYGTPEDPIERDVIIIARTPNDSAFLFLSKDAQDAQDGLTLLDSVPSGYIFTYCQEWGLTIDDDVVDKVIIDLRKKDYPIWQDQLDDIYHNGIDAWKATIKVTKDKYPKS
jgi:hypothetical protein